MLNPEQEEQILKQIGAYEKKMGTGLIKVPFGDKTLELQLDPFVANPEIMNSGGQMIDYLAKNPDLVKNKIVTDMGTGCGLIGIASALSEAKLVFMPDIDPRAVNNAKFNVEKLKLGRACEVFESDLFKNYGGRPKSQIQIFNHPFFAGPPIKDKEWTRMMLADTELLDRYFKEAPRYSTPEATYILPWLTLAGHEGDELDNDPGKRAPAHGYELVNIAEQTPMNMGLQQAMFKIYQFRKPWLKLPDYYFFGCRDKILNKMPKNVPQTSSHWQFVNP